MLVKTIVWSLVGAVVGYTMWQLGMRWLLDRVGVDGDAYRLRPPIQKFSGFAPALREQTEKRRAAADSIRRRAAHVETGAPIADVLRLVRK